MSKAFLGFWSGRSVAQEDAIEPGGAVLHTPKDKTSPPKRQGSCSKSSNNFQVHSEAKHM